MFKKIAPDKWKHFYMSILMGAVLQTLGWWLLTDKLVLATILSSIIVIVISYGFELFSKTTGWGHYDIMDAIASIIGGMLGIGVFWIVYLIL